MPPAPATRVIFSCRLWDVVALSARDSPLAHTFRGTQAERAFVSLALTHFAESNHAVEIHGTEVVTERNVGQCMVGGEAVELALDTADTGTVLC